MTDLEMTKLSADAMGIEYEVVDTGFRSMLRMTRYEDWPHDDQSEWNPLDDDSEAMALVKRFRLTISIPSSEHAGWIVAVRKGRKLPARIQVGGVELNRAIVECVAKLQSAISKGAAAAADTDQSLEHEGDTRGMNNTGPVVDDFTDHTKF